MAPSVSSGFRRWWRHPRPGDTGVGGGVSGEVVRGASRAAGGGVGEGARSPPGQHHPSTTITSHTTSSHSGHRHRLLQGSSITPTGADSSQLYDSHREAPGGRRVPLTSSSAASAAGTGNRRPYPGVGSVRHTGGAGSGGSLRWRRSPVGPPEGNTDWRTGTTSPTAQRQGTGVSVHSGGSAGRPIGGGSGFHSQDFGTEPRRVHEGRSNNGVNRGSGTWGQHHHDSVRDWTTAGTDRPTQTTNGNLRRLNTKFSQGDVRDHFTVHNNSTLGSTGPDDVNVITSTGSTSHSPTSVTSGVTPDPGGGTTSIREHIISGNSNNNSTGVTQTQFSTSTGRSASNNWVNDLLTAEQSDSTTALYSDYPTNSTTHNSSSSNLSYSSINSNSTTSASTLLRDHLQNYTTTSGLNASTNGAGSSGPSGTSTLWDSLSLSNWTSSDFASSSIGAGTEGYALLNNGNQSLVTNLPFTGNSSGSGTFRESGTNSTASSLNTHFDSAPTSEPTTAFPGYLDLKDLPWEFSDYPDSLSMFGNLTDCGTGSMAWSSTNGSYGCWPGASNGTNGTWTGGGTGIGSGGPGDVLAPRYWALLLVVFPLFTIVGNILVVTSVYRERALRTVTNYFIVSLAIADIAVALFVMPLAIYTEVNNGTWRLGDVLCDAWVALDVMGCTSSILNLTAISVDRFIAVTQPIRYAKHKHSRRVDIMLAMTWIVSIAISSPIALGMNYTEARSQTPELCIFYNSEFLICSSMGSFYIPCIVMLVLYWRIFRSIHLRAKKQKLKALKMTKQLGNDNMKNVIENKAQVNAAVSGNEQQGLSQAQERRRKCPIHGSPNRGTALATHAHTNNETSFANVVTTTDTGEDDSVQGGGGGSGSGLGCEVIKSPLSDDTDHVIPNDKSTEFMLSPQSEDSHGEYRDGGDTSGYSPPVAIVVETQFSGNITSPTSPKTLLSPPPRVKSTVLGFRNHSACKLNFMRREHKESPRKSVTKFNFHLRHSKKKKQSSAIRRERKATKTLAIVLGVFLFCWLPFFTVNVMNAICIKLDVMHKPECNIDPMLMSFFVWLGYINSFLNPVIYTIFNIEFRKAFKNILINPLGKRL